MTKIPPKPKNDPKTQKITKISLKPKKLQKYPRNLKMTKILPKQKKMTKIPLKPKKVPKYHRNPKND